MMLVSTTSAGAVKNQRSSTTGRAAGVSVKSPVMAWMTRAVTVCGLRRRHEKTAVQTTELCRKYRQIVLTSRHYDWSVARKFAETAPQASTSVAGLMGCENRLKMLWIAAVLMTLMTTVMMMVVIRSWRYKAMISCCSSCQHQHETYRRSAHHFSASHDQHLITGAR